MKEGYCNLLLKPKETLSFKFINKKGFKSQIKWHEKNQDEVEQFVLFRFAFIRRFCSQIFI